MTNRRLFTAGCVGLFLSSGLTGCAHLKIDVDVYKGQLILTDEAKLGEAVGLVNTILAPCPGGEKRGVGKGSEGKRGRGDDEPSHQRSDSEETPLGKHRTFRNDLIRWYMTRSDPGPVRGLAKLASTSDDINTLWKDYLLLRPNGDSAPSTESDTAKQKLAMALFQCGGACMAAGLNHSLADAINIRNPLRVILYPVAGYQPRRIFARVREADLDRGVALEEAGRMIMLLADDVMDENSRTSVSRIMQSVTPGIISEVLRTPFSYAFDAIDRWQWGEINKVDVWGAGDVDFVIVKGEIGNWHIKGISTDQDEFVNAVFDGVDGMIDILARQYGIGTNDGEEGAGEVTPAITRELEAAKADRAMQQLQTANMGFALRLSQALDNKDEDALRSAVKQAVAVYATQVEGIEFGATTPAAGEG